MRNVGFSEPAAENKSLAQWPSSRIHAGPGEGWDAFGPTTFAVSPFATFNFALNELKFFYDLGDVQEVCGMKEIRGLVLL